jgi:hypothetical protein
MNARYRNGLEKGEDLVPGQPTDATLEFIDKDALVDGPLELYVASSSTTWVLSDERRATNTIDLGASWLEIPTDGPEPAAAAAPVPAAPAVSAVVPVKKCRTKATIRLPRKVRGKRLTVRVNGRKVKARVRGRKLRVSLPRTKAGRVVVKVRGPKGLRLTKRFRGCRR